MRCCTALEATRHNQLPNEGKKAKGRVPEPVKIASADWKLDYSLSDFTQLPKPEPKPKLKIIGGKDTEESLAKVKDALEHVSADDRARWVDTGLAIKSTYPGNDGFKLWSDWSATSSKCQPDELQAKWTGLDPNQIGIGSLFHHAKKGGGKKRKDS